MSVIIFRRQVVRRIKTVLAPGAAKLAAVGNAPAETVTETFGALETADHGCNVQVLILNFFLSRMLPATLGK